MIDYFIRDYQKGKTPNPCVMCNRKIKSGPLIQKSMELECDFLATGHYASVQKSADGKSLQLIRPQDKEKDQTYFLHGISSFELKKMVFPLANLIKNELRSQILYVLNDSTITSTGFLNYLYLYKNVIKPNMYNHVNNHKKIWNIFVLVNWLKNNNLS